MKANVNIALIMLAFSSSSYSCTCGQIDYESLVPGSAAAVLVTLDSFEHRPPSNPLFPPMNQLNFTIDKILFNPRNKISSHASSVSAMSSATTETCGMQAVKGAHYLLFLNENDFIQTITLSTCDGSLIIESQSDNLIPTIYRAIDKYK